MTRKRKNSVTLVIKLAFDDTKRIPNLFWEILMQKLVMENFDILPGISKLLQELINNDVTLKNFDISTNMRCKAWY